MKLAFVFLLQAVLVLGVPRPAEVISSANMVEHDGKYHYHYILDDGSKATQNGLLKKFDEEHDGEIVEGTFSFVADDGQEYAVSYTADENGYRPVGAHLPTPPPVPQSVIDTLKYLEEHPPSEETTKEQ